MSTPRKPRPMLIRPGQIIRAVLLGELPLKTGEYVTAAAITDIFNAYKLVVAEHNKEELDKPLKDRSFRRGIHGMKASSFYIHFKFASLAGLVELVREEPPIAMHDGFWHPEKTNDEVHAVKAARKIFRLSERGKTDQAAWDNLQRSWYETRAQS